MESVRLMCKIMFISWWARKTNMKSNDSSKSISIFNYFIQLLILLNLLSLSQGLINPWLLLKRLFSICRIDRKTMATKKLVGAAVPVKTVAIQPWKLCSPPYLAALKLTVVWGEKWKKHYLNKEIQHLISTPQDDATVCLWDLKFFPVLFPQELYSECDKLRQIVCQMASESQDNDSSLGKNDTHLLLIDWIWLSLCWH